MKKSVDIDNYIKKFPSDVQVLLNKMRMSIRKAAPEAEETMKYGIPTFVLNGNLVHFGGFKKHIGFYPAPSGIKKFKKELSIYKNSKGAVHFPLGEPIPFDLVTKIVEFRAKENMMI